MGIEKHHDKQHSLRNMNTRPGTFCDYKGFSLTLNCKYLFVQTLTPIKYNNHRLKLTAPKIKPRKNGNNLSDADYIRTKRLIYLHTITATMNTQMAYNTQIWYKEYKCMRWALRMLWKKKLPNVRSSKRIWIN